MAEPKLTYGIYFDLEDGLQKAQQDWSKVKQQLQRTIDAKPLKVDIDILKGVEGIDGSITSITSKLKELSTAWNKMSESAKFDEGGNLSAEAQKLVNDFSQFTAQLQTSGKTLEQLSAEARKSVEQELKDIEKRNIANEKAAQKEIELNQRRYKSQVEYNQQVKAMEGQKSQDFDQLKFKYSNQEYEQNRKSLEVQQQINQSKREQAQIADKSFDKYKTELRLQEQIQANEANRAKQASYNASRSQGLERVRILKAEENSISAINAKLAIQRQRLNEVDMGSKKFQKIAAEVQRLSAALDQANARVRSLTTTQVQSATKATTAIRKQTDALGEQAGYLQRFTLRMVMYSAIFGSVNFLRSIRDTTAQFQLQQVALGGIIQDGQKAAQIFSQIKEAAQKSPFQVLDMVTYTKQLAAYRIETDKLFGTMNMLADISAGLGVGMDRLILVFGQVKAAGKLLGSEVRQFREAGLGIVEMLSDRYSKLEGTMVSVAEVTKRISDGMVSFKDVQAVLEGITSAGGMFYQMQAKQANTLAGELSNLKDALQIAQADMGATLEPMFLASIRSTKAVLQNWQSLWAIIKVTGTALLVYKGITMSAAVAENALVLAKAKSIALDTTSARLTPRLITLIIGHNNAIKLSRTMYELLIASQARAAAATNGLSKAFFKLTTFLLTNPYTAIIAAVAALGVAIWAASSNANKLQKELAKIGAEATTNINYLNRNFARLAKEALNAANGSSTQKKALDELNRTYGDILPAQSLTIEGLKAMKGNYEAVTKAIYEKIKAQQYENSVSAIQEEYTAKFTSAEGSTTKFLKSIGLEPSEINIVMDRIRRSIDDGLIDVKNDAKTNAKLISDIIKSITGKKVEIPINIETFRGGYSERLENSLNSLIATYSLFNKEVDNLNTQFDQTPTLLKSLVDGFSDIETQLKGRGLVEGTFEFNEAVTAEKIKRYTDFISQQTKTQLDDMPKYNALEHLLSFDIPSTPKYTFEEVSGAIKISVDKANKELSELIGTKEQNIIKDRAENVSKSIGVSMDYLSEYLMKSGEDTKTWADRISKEYSNLDADLKTYYTNISNYGAKITSEQITQARKLFLGGLTPQDIENQRKALQLLYKTPETKSTGSDPRIQNMEREVQLVQEIYKRYKEYLTYMSSEKAKVKIQDLYGASISKLKFGAAFDTSELKGVLTKYKDAIAKLPKSEQAILKLQLGIDDVSWNEFKDDLQKNIEKLSDDISRAQISKNFFEKMLGLTGNRDLAMTLTMSVYGDMGEGLAAKIKEQLTTAFSGIDISKYISGETIDYKSLSSLIAKLPAESQKLAKGLVNSGLTANAEILSNLYSTLGKFEEYENKRMTIMRKGIEERKQIEQLAIDESEKKELKQLSQESEKKQIAKISYADFKDSDLYITMFENLDFVSTRVLENLKLKLQELKNTVGESLDPTQMKEIVQKMEDVDAKLATKNPFKSLISNIKAYREELKKQSKESREAEFVQATAKVVTSDTTVKDYQKRVLAQESVVTATEKEHGALSNNAFMQKVILDNLKSQLIVAGKTLEKDKTALVTATNKLKVLSNSEKAIYDSISGVQDGIAGLSMIASSLKKVGESLDWGDEFSAVMDSIGEILGGLDTIGQGIQSIISGNIFRGIGQIFSGVVDTVAGLFGAGYIKRVAAANREIKRQQELLDRLEYSYSMLGKAAESALGTDYIQNYNSQLENLQAQQQAYLKQAEAERSKGKKADSDKIKEYENAARDTADQIIDMQGKVAEAFTGTDVTSAAKDFARAWLDAYKQFGNTADAMSGKFKDMINDMIVNSILAQMMQKELQPIFDMIDKMSPEEVNDPNFWKKISERAKEAGINMNVGATNLIAGLENAGVDIKDITSELTGITKSIAGMTEETALGLAAAFNTQTFYLSDMRLDLKAIRMVIEGQGLTAKVPDYITLQNNYLSTLPRIEANTANTAVQCSRAADACERAVSEVQGLMKIRGGEGSRAIPVRIVS